MKSPTFDELIRRFTNWAQANENIHAAIIVGSRAQSEDSYDHHSDLDIIIFAYDTEQLTKNQEWLLNLGHAWLVDLNVTGPGDYEWIVIFKNGNKADFIIAKAEPHLELKQMLVNSPYKQTIKRGSHILIDRSIPSTNNIEILNTEFLKPQLNSSEFMTRINRTLIMAHRAAKFIDRQDMWRGQWFLNEIRRDLLWFFEKHALFSSHVGIDTWYDGRKIEQWASPMVKNALPGLFAKYDQEDMARAFRSILTIMHLVASDIANTTDIPYPTVGQKATIDWLVNKFPGIFHESVL